MHALQHSTKRTHRLSTFIIFHVLRMRKRTTWMHIWWRHRDVTLHHDVQRSPASNTPHHYPWSL